MWYWNSKLRSRPWVRTLSGGVAQIFTRVFGTTVVIPATPRHLTLLASQSNTATLLASRSNTVTLLASES